MLHSTHIVEIAALVIFVADDLQIAGQIKHLA